jgi:hypothetical protein
MVQQPTPRFLPAKFGNISKLNKKLDDVDWKKRYVL